MEEKTIKCNNCKQEISESKITLHEAFCLRNNKYCEKCNQVILISQYDEHIKSHENKKTEILNCYELMDFFRRLEE